ncbi:MAG: anthranilate phosphoribosyltransferase [Steroidobacteraceae bacterium]
MSTLKAFLERLIAREDLAADEAAQLLTSLTSPDVSPALAGALLVALRSKGETAEELRGFAAAMRSLARKPEIANVAGAVDIVGTGGDRSGSINISTGASLLAAAAGLQVVKHGNRSISSRAGSADVLEALGVPMPLDEAAAGACFAQHGFTFLFAPYYHPAMKAIAPVRAALGVRTVFNVLGPLSNPAAPPFHVIGAFSLPMARLMAQALCATDITRAFVVHGAGGWDEPTPVGPFTLLDVRPGSIEECTRSASDYGLANCSPEELAGADAQHNAEVLRRVLRGEERGAQRAALVLSAALALQVTGVEPDARAAAARAGAAIDSGAAGRLLANLSTLAFDTAMARA